MYTKQHYKSITKIFYNMKPVKSDLETFDEFMARLNYYNKIVARFIDLFTEDNDNFNKVKFIEAIE